MSGRKQYTDAEKAAYYKKKANELSRARVSKSTTRVPKYKYPGYGKNLGKVAGQLVGNYYAPGVGGMVGSFVGGYGGDMAQALLKKATGFGDYRIKGNSLLYNRSDVPVFVTGKNCVRIKHREFIKDIRSSVNFESSQFIINPGRSNTFPWLSKIAQNYEQYIFAGVLLEYKTSSATAVSSTNTALGMTIMASQYNLLAPSFTSKQQMEAYEFSNSAVPCESFLHAIECDPKFGNEIRTIWNPADSDINADPRNYDLCKTTIATQGMQEASTIGEFWISYDVYLCSPKLSYNDNIMDCYRVAAPSTIVFAYPFGTKQFLTDGSYTNLIPADNNIGFVKVDPDSVKLSDFIVDPGFNGVLRCEACYFANVVGGATMQLSPWTSSTLDLAEDVTPEYLGAGANFGDTYISTVNDSKYFTAVSYWKISGGYNSSGVSATIIYNNMIFTGTDTWNNCSVNFSAVASQSILPTFSVSVS